MYKVIEEPLGTTRPIRVIVVGAGASGLNTARHMDLHMENFELTVYEKNSDVGGTWFENRYPGCACDIPSHNYQFTWEPNPEWTQYYSPWDEILEYFQGIARKYELYKYIRLEHNVCEATWDEEEGVWKVKIRVQESGEIIEDQCHILINGTGILNNWKWPDIPGLHSFKGDLVHSATWSTDHNIDGKRVAVLGSGSSGIQIIPTIQPRTSSLFAFVRSPTWITAGFAQSHAGPGGANFACEALIIILPGHTTSDIKNILLVSANQKREFRENPELYLRYRKEIEGELNTRFKFIIADSEEQVAARNFSVNEMKSKIKDEKLARHLMPDNFAVGCRRPTPGNGYLEALSEPNVRVVTDEISRVSLEGIVLVTGETLEIDTLICATGFDISFCPRFKLFGRNGQDIENLWREKPEAYLSTAVPGFPNYFMFLGPNSPVGHGSVLPIIEHATKYIINMMKKIQTQHVKAVSPTPAAARDFNEHTAEFMKRTAWATPCRSWFKNGTIDGPIVALHPGSRIHWFHMMQNIRFEDFEYTYFGKNQFQYLGNGFSTREEPPADTTWYFEAPEDGYDDY